MAVKEIYAKTLLGHVRQPDTWFGLKYNMNLYRGCQHRCIYCDSRSACYQIENFDKDVLVKTNAIDLLRSELSRKRVKGTIGTGSMNDPYMPVEKKLNLTGRALEAIADFRFPVHIITKSDLVLKDIDTIEKIARTYAAVSFTITTTDDALAKKIEPGAPPPSARLAAMRELSSRGILTGVLMMPILPFIEDTPENIQSIVRQAAEVGAGYIIPSLGMTCRDGQREYFYERLDHSFPGVRQQYERAFGNQYQCSVQDYKGLSEVLNRESKAAGIPLSMPVYTRHHGEQLSMF